MGRDEKMWCTVCGARFTDDEIKGWGCPKCGDQGVPCGVEGDRRVEVNWHELHILVVWAENWAQRCADNPGNGGKNMGSVVTAIARRLQRQHPDLPALTLTEEVANLPAALQKSGIKIDGPIETVGIAKPMPLPINGPGAVGHSREQPYACHISLGHCATDNPQIFCRCWRESASPEDWENRAEEQIEKARASMKLGNAPRTNLAQHKR